MRPIKYIVLHCTAGPQNQTVEVIQNYWKQSLGWKTPGYHHLIKADGTVVNLVPIEKPSNGVAGHNANSIHISYIGGANGIDNRTAAQKQTQIALIGKYKAMFPGAKILGHRDFPGVTKLCPSFNVSTWLKSVGL
jgi:N-acetylmuramoyl-L-alanine amidase